jgi:hypothetical protein
MKRKKEGAFSRMLPCTKVGKALQSSNQFLRDIEAVVEFIRYSDLKIDAL